MIWSVTESISSRHVLLLHMQYDIYDTVKPAIFYRGARVKGVLSPPPTPATSFLINERVLLFLTSELGEDESGVLHDGVLEVEWDEKNSSILAVMVKLAFTEEHQQNLVQEWLVHKYLLTESTAGIPSIIGVFYHDDDEGPSCFLSYHTGVSLADRKELLSSDERHVAPNYNLSAMSCAIVIGHHFWLVCARFTKLVCFTAIYALKTYWLILMM